MTIVINRISILVSCITWFAILSFSYPAPKKVFFAVALILGMIEKLSRGANILSMERDWVPTLANTSVDAQHPAPYDLTHLNTTMRRLDMLCKLIAPLAVSTFVSTVESERIAAVVVAAISTLSLGPECWGVQQVWDQNSRLRARKGGVGGNAINSGQDQPMQLCYTKTSSARLASNLFERITLQISGYIRAYMAELGYYFRSSVLIPSLCAAIPHASVLTFSGTMLTYLLNAGYSLKIITAARTSGAVFEIGSTFIFPWAVGTLRAPNRRDYHEVEQREPSSGFDTRLGHTDDNHAQGSESDPVIERSVVKVGHWALSGLLLSLVSKTALKIPSSSLEDQCQWYHSQIPAVLSLIFVDAGLHTTTSSISSPHKSPTVSYLFNTIILIFSISLSLLFRWTYDLCGTQLTQTLIPVTKRSSFGGTEMSIVSLVSLGHWIAAAVWHTQSDFKWLALGSFVIVAIGTGAYWWWQGWWRSWETVNGYRMEEELDMDNVM